jgi:hypothetical protein
MLSGQHGLREYIAEGGAQSSAGGVYMTLRAFEPELHRQIGFSMRRACGNAQI